MNNGEKNFKNKIKWQNKYVTPLFISSSPNTAQHICMTYMQIEMIRIVVGVDVVIAVVVFDIPGKNRHNIFFIFLHYKKLKII